MRKPNDQRSGWIERGTGKGPEAGDKDGDRHLDPEKLGNIFNGERWGQFSGGDRGLGLP